MKTPEQIAAEIYAQYENRRDNLILTPEGYKLDLIAAIEADRAQRVEPAVAIFHPGPPDEVAEYVELVAEQIDQGYTSGGVHGGSGIYWESGL